MCFRAEQQLRGRKLGGYAAVFAQPTDLGDGRWEELAVGSLDRALGSSDVRALYNHSVLHVLGRQASGTLRLRADATGLEYEVDLPDASYARDLMELVERGDIDGASFGFVPDAVDRGEAGMVTHTCVAEVVDVSPVTFPAYPGASTEARSLRLRAPRRASQLIRARSRATMRG